MEARLGARLDDAKWMITGSPPFVDAFQKYPDKKLLEKRRNFDSILKKICKCDDWCLRLDLTILCRVLILPKKVHEIRDKQNVLDQCFKKCYPKLVLSQWASEPKRPYPRFRKTMRSLRSYSEVCFHRSPANHCVGINVARSRFISPADSYSNNKAISRSAVFTS